MYAVEDILQILNYRLSGNANAANCGYPATPGPLRSTPDQQTGAATTHPRHTPLRTRLWFRLCDAYADSRAGMRPTPSCEQLVEGHR